MAFSLSPKENFIRALEHKPTEYTPCVNTDTLATGVALELERGNANTNWLDGFGVRWVMPESAGGGMMPAPNEYMFEDMGDWKKKVVIPDISKLNWEEMAARDLANFNRDTQILTIVNFNGIFERLAAFMGFENSLIAMLEEPDDVNEFFEVITDYKIELVKYYAKYYKPDQFTYCDDLATQRGPFMSPQTYRELIKPHHARLVKAIRDCGIYPDQHTCGYSQDIIEDFIDIDLASWSSVQPSNDIEGLIEKYGDRFTLTGGFDVNGAPGQIGASLDDVIAEVNHCLDDYGKYNKGFIFSGALIRPGIGPEVRAKAMVPILSAVKAYREKQV